MKRTVELAGNGLMRNAYKILKPKLKGHIEQRRQSYL